MKYGKGKLRELLLSIDEEATLLLGTSGQRYPIVIVGGSAFLLHDLTSRPNDIEDLESPAMLDAIDWDMMDHLVYGKDEAMASALSQRRYDEMASEYERYARRRGHAPDV